MREQAVIVAHGWPSFPAILEADLAWLAAQVESRLSGWRIRSATLASPGALWDAIDATDPSLPTHIYPFFMSDGWFVNDNLRRRVEETGRDNLIWHVPFGLSPKIAHLCVSVLRTFLQGTDPATLTLVAVAHGSPDNPRPAEVARNLTDKIFKSMGFLERRNGFVDEPPSLEEVLKIETPAICLPLFASLAGHMRQDLAAAISASGFKGPVLPAIGTHPRVAELIAEDLTASDQR